MKLWEYALLAVVMCATGMLVLGAIEYVVWLFTHLIR